MYSLHGYDAEKYFEKGPEETTDKDSMDNDSTASSNSADDIDLSDPNHTSVDVLPRLCCMRPTKSQISLGTAHSYQRLCYEYKH